MTTDTAPRKTLAERIDELTGHDEEAIDETFGYSIYDVWDALIESVMDRALSRKANVRVSRALLFVEKVHDGLPRKVAHEAVMAMNMGQVNDELRLPEVDEDDGAGDERVGDDAAEVPDSDATPAGKGQPGESDAA